MLPMQNSLPRIEWVYNGFEQHFWAPPHNRILIDLDSPCYEVPSEPAILWELKWRSATFELFIPFIEKLLEPLRSRTVGIVIDRANAAADRPWREVIAWLPEEIPLFLHLEPLCFEHFPYALLDTVHMIGSCPYPYALPLLDENLSFPPSKRLTKAVLLPADGTLDERAIEERVIAEERLIYDWDGVEELTIFPEKLSVQGARMVRGFQAAGGMVKAFRGDGASPQPLEI